MNGTVGYIDRLSVAPGERVKLHVSSTAANWRAQLMRLLALEIPSFGVPRRAVAIDSVPVIEREGIAQETAVGSYGVARVPRTAAQSGLTVCVIAMPTRPDAGPQAILAARPLAGDGDGGWSIGIDGTGVPQATLGLTDGSTLTLGGSEPLVAGCWYRFALVVDNAGSSATFAVDPVGTFTSNRVVTGRGPSQWASRVHSAALGDAGDAEVLIGCGALGHGGQRELGFDGRIERPAIVAAPVALPSLNPDGADGSFAALLRHEAVVAAWDPADGITRAGFEHPSRLSDVCPHGLHATLVNHPTRAVISHAWTGEISDFRFAPDEYAAIHFHATDMTDCRWQPQAEIELPSSLPSGVYGIHLLDSDGAEDMVPVIVRPAADTPTADALLVMSTNSYLAYGNDHVDIDSPRTQVWNQIVPALDRWERFRDSKRELGLSLYEAHSDGAGVCHSSWRRPLLTLRPTVYRGNGPVWQFTGDMQIVDWLDRTGRSADVVCDRDVHDGGIELLSQYRLVITGSHPEYPSEEMLVAYERHVAAGGRLMYMGGNGMYWVTGYDPEDEQVIEIRRWGGTQAWNAAAGEYHLSFTGRLGGPWRFGGRPPQKTFGVGFVAAGPTTAGGTYVRVADREGPVDWALANVREDEFGADGVMGAAAGIELDAVDTTLGTPAATFVLATSVGHTDDMLEARENFNMTSRILGGARNPRVHSDAVIVPRENGGAVFSTGSIAFSGALAAGDWDGDVARLLGNVYDRFVSGEPVLDG